ncbi:TonB-dependent receptor plug domain-containing protein [Salinicola tamaricis]|uniref:TonB-dependent receptor plug domain-containing protein n=1 Tax=Salinicola tamaricis TaxID=1771309 RepID=UPI001F5C65F9|nr:TonB-dependent receptor plug domain-containing protein [Salinicola tamaricis]
MIRVISRQELEQQRRITSDSSEILSNLLPDYSPPRQKMSGSGETLRGRTPLVMIDGIPQSNPLRPTGRELHTIDFSMIDHIEVIKGANATNGLGAAGGVINLITKRPEPGSLISTSRPSSPRRPPSWMAIPTATAPTTLSAAIAGRSTTCSR